MLRTHHQQLLVLVIAFDFALGALVYFALLTSPAVSGVQDLPHPFASEVAALSFTAVLAWPLSAHFFDIYGSSRTLKLSAVLARTALAGLAVGITLAASAFTFSAPVHATFPLVCGAAQALVLSLSHLALVVPLRTVRRYGRNFRNVLIVGTGPRAAHVQRMIESRQDWGLRVIGLVDDEDTAIDPSLYNAKLFKIDSMPELVRDQVIDRVIIAYPRSMLPRLSSIVSVCASAGIPFTMLADLFGDYLPPPRTTRFGSLAALEFAPVHHDPLALSLKRLVDIAGSAVGLIVALPVLFVSAIAIKLQDGGSIIFGQTRCGLHGHPFTIFKLRTMCVDAEARLATLAELNECDGPVFKVRHDPRITPVGRILRKLSIDELPQLWNVLIGDMSLVGPRPPLPQEVGQYQTFERRRLSMRPGITCIWQVSGRSSIGFDRWVQLDVQYIDSWSLGLDLKILLRTIPAVLKGEGAC